jgi:PAS domain S-box-containing protein
VRNPVRYRFWAHGARFPMVTIPPSSALRGELVLAEARLLEELGEAVVGVDLEGRVTYWSRTAEALYGWTADEVLGRAVIPIFVPAETRPDAEEILSTVLTTGEWRGEFEVVRRDGSRFPALVRSILVRDGSGRALGIVGLVRDHTEVRETRDRLERQLRQLAAAESLAGLGSWDSDFAERTAHWSAGLRQIWGLAADAPPLPFDEVLARVHPEDRPRLLESRARAQTGEGDDYEFRLVRPTGEERVVRTRYVFERDPSGTPFRAFGVVHDITEASRTARQLADRLRQQEAVAESATHALSAQGVDEILQRTVRMAAAVLGVEFAQVLRLDPAEGVLTLVAGQGWNEGTVGTSRVGPGARSQAGYTLIDGGPVIAEDLDRETRFRPAAHLVTHRVRSGITVVIPGRDAPWGVLGIHSRSVRRFTSEDGTFTRALAGVVGGVIERDRSEREIEAAREDADRARRRLELVSRRLLEVQEETARHLARELHDEVGQQITGLLLRIGANEPASTRGLSEVLKELSRKIHAVSTDFRPPMLDALGLRPALEWLFTSRVGPSGLRVAFSHDGLDRRFPPMVETTVFRVVQEAITNVMRYAGVSEAEVEVRAHDDRIEVAIIDHGVGFEVAAVLAQDESGLVFLQERVRLAGGHLEIRSNGSHGTRLHASIPATPPGGEG